MLCSMFNLSIDPANKGQNCPPLEGVQGEDLLSGHIPTYRCDECPGFASQILRRWQQIPEPDAAQLNRPNVGQVS